MPESYAELEAMGQRYEAVLAAERHVQAYSRAREEILAENRCLAQRDFLAEPGGLEKLRRLEVERT